ASVGLAYVYLGYWVEGSERMQYKVRFRPMEKLGRDGWERFEPAEQADAIGRAAALRRTRGDGETGVEGGLKDGVHGAQERYAHS
ncbi:MAG: arginyltransferase, partial [Novosphingobium sp.]